MFTHPRKNLLHKQLELLSHRTTLNDKNKKTLRVYQSGYEGETYLSSIFQKELKDLIQLYDLSLEIDGRLIQIDCLLILQNECMIIEVKNYKSEFINFGEKWQLRCSRKMIISPVYQTHRANTLLQNFFNENNIPFNVTHQIIFTHPNFILYNASIDDKIIFPSQFPKFVRSLQQKSIQYADRHRFLSEKLKIMNKEDSLYNEVLDVDYNTLKKGVTCKKCGKFVEDVGRYNVKCENCGYTEPVRDSVLRSILEFRLLFRDRPVTMSAISHWTADKYTKHYIRSVLREHFDTVSTGRGTHYVEKVRKY